MIQSFWDEFGARRKKPVMLAEPKIVLKKPEPYEILANKEQSKYRSGFGKMMHMMR